MINRLFSTPRAGLAFALAFTIGVGAGCTCGGVGYEPLQFACTNDSECVTGYRCVEAVCSKADGGSVGGGQGGGSGGGQGGAQGGGSGGGTGGATGGGAGGGTGGSGGSDGGCEFQACGCFDAGPCYKNGLASTNLRFPWDGGAGCSVGALACGGTDLVCNGQHVPQTEFCDGIDTDCDGIPDPATCACNTGWACYQGAPGTLNVNPQGQTTCHGGTWDCTRPLGQQCVGQVLPAAKEVCDGLDDDCNGLVDDNVDLPVCGVGVCAGARKTCTNGAVTACDYAANPPPGYSATEICNDGLDNNCNGFTDEGCVCVVDAGVACWSGQPSACPADAGACLGVCVRGTQKCGALADGGLGWGTCGGEVKPTAENTAAACTNGLDDDCDGLTDCADPDCSGQKCGAGNLLTCSAAACKCVVAGGTAETAEVTCGDGKDNDCDGKIDCADPDCATGVACGSNGLKCAAQACACSGNGGAAQATETSCADGFDNDCDGLIDCLDSNCTGQACGAGNGRTCVSSACTCSGNGGVAQATETSCGDGKDNDCDGKIDCADPDCGGLSCGTNSKTCHAAVCTCLASGAAPAATETVCNDGLDNNCDGKTDCADTTACATGTACGTGGATCAAAACACSGNGGVAQPAGETACSDGFDNDCDGLVDCADPQCSTLSCGANGKTCHSTVCTCLASGAAPAASETSCTDGVDNNCDGKVDCADTTACAAGTTCGANGYKCAAQACSCSGNGGAVQATETSCGDGFDNDCDGKADCLDPNCAGQACGTGKTCSNTTCVAGGSCLPDGGAPAASETNCKDGIDDDCNGLIDCADPACNLKKCSFTAPAATCCGTGPSTCKDLANDPANCGLCGTVCTSGTCNPMGNGSGSAPWSGACGCTSTCPTSPGTGNGNLTCTGVLPDGGSSCSCQGNIDQCDPANNGTTITCTQGSPVGSRYCTYK